MTERRGTADLRMSDLCGLALSACRAHDGQRCDEGSLGKWEQEATALVLAGAWSRAPDDWHETVRAILEGLGDEWIKALRRALEAGEVLALERLLEVGEHETEDERLERAYGAAAASEPTPRDTSHATTGRITSHGPGRILGPGIVRPTTGTIAR